MIALHLGRVEWKANPRGSERESPHQLLSNKGSGFNKDSFLGKELMQPRRVIFLSVFFGTSCALSSDVLGESGEWQDPDSIF